VKREQAPLRDLFSEELTSTKRDNEIKALSKALALPPIGKDTALKIEALKLAEGVHNE
jgi:hypothetical protein